MHNIRIKLSEKLTLVGCIGLAVAFFLAGCATQQSDSKSGVADVDPSQSSEITSIELSEEADAINVLVRGTEPLTYTSVKQPAPLGVILYFPNTKLHALPTDVQSSGDPVTSIHAGQVEASDNYKTTCSV